ncbi:transcriptional regulator FtrA [Pseudoxanthomonas putridarboris]|uniref:Transcriptional regulator FtrA n=1 Tax=Pseudoxanthomonas putridarboris TaxID=752605 RepID=A0ABU9IYW0_9GAMM
MPLFDQIMPKRRKPPAKPNPLVAALVYDGLCAFEFACAAEVFGLPRPELGPDWYRFETCAPHRRPVRGQYGMQITADDGLDRLASAGTVIIPGWSGIDAPVPARILEALRDAHARGARLLSICSGAFVLAATGLLDGKRATTHWRYADALRQRYPSILIDPDVLYIDEGQLLTSAGSAAGLDLCLHLVRRDHGPDVANQVARRLVIPPHRDGGQAQFVERPIQKRERDALSPLMDAMRRRMDKAYSIAELAGMAAMSERTFIRRFKDATGTTPADWLIALRIDRARELLESSAHSIDSIAEQTGLGTATTMRHHFRRKLGTSPMAYRRRFGGQGERD